VGGGEEGLGHKAFLEFFQREFLSAPAVFSGYTTIPWAHFDTSLMRIGYGYENMTSSVAVVKPFYYYYFFVFHLFSVERGAKCGQNHVCHQKLQFTINYAVF